MDQTVLLTLECGAVALGYLAAVFGVIWFVPWSNISKILKLVFYLGSFLGTFGLAFALPLTRVGGLFGVEVITWANVFMGAQLLIWPFVLNIIREAIVHARREGRALARLEQDEAGRVQLSQERRILLERLGTLQTAIEDIRVEILSEPSVRQSLDVLRASVENVVSEEIIGVKESVEEKIDEIVEEGGERENDDEPS